MAKLVVCNNCAQHIRYQATTCPFCANVVPRSGTPVRAAIAVALGLTAATAIAFTPACAYGCPDASCSGSGASGGMGGSGGTIDTTGVTSSSGGGAGGKLDTSAAVSGSSSGGGTGGTPDGG